MSGSLRIRVACIALGAFVAAAVGVFPSAGALSRLLGSALAAFPCQGHGCGCASLSDCLDGCCCFSESELARWRRGDGGEADDSRPTIAAPPPACCAATAEPEQPEPHDARNLKGPAPTSMPTSITALGCKGARLLMFVPPAPVAAARAGSVPELRVGRDLAPPRAAMLRPQSALQPPSPPPR